MVLGRCLTIISNNLTSAPWLGLFTVVCLGALPSIVYSQQDNQTQASQDYRLGIGDKIEIVVYDEPDLGVITTLSQSGVISYPFLGDLKITGLTSKEVEQLISSGLRGSYLVDPKVSLAILQYRPFYIQGEVKLSGGYPYQPGLTLRKAISLAGGFTERASQTKISVVREKGGKRNKLAITLDDFINPGDIITVEQSFF
jgi:polysaccharide export outer membrane protein